MRTPLLLTALCCVILSLLTTTACKKTPPCTEPVNPEALATEFKLRDIGVPCTDEHGNPIESDNLIIHFPQGMTDAQIQAIRDKWKPDEIDSCLCDPRLQNWKWPDSVELNIEETVSQMTQQSKREGTGWSSHLNHIVQGFDVFGPPDVQDTIPEKSVTALQEGKVIAILDSGLDLFYSAKGMMHLYTDNGTGCAPSGAHGWNFVSDNGDIQDDNGHGTAVASAIVEGLNEAILEEEYTCGATFLILKTLDARGVGNLFNAICAIQYAVEAEAEIINISWGYYNTDNAFFRDSILSLKLSNGNHPLFVTSMGNLGLVNADTTFHYPSAYGFRDEMGHIIGVGGDLRSSIWDAVANLEATPAKLAPFSNFDTTGLLLSAPGEKVKVWDRVSGSIARYKVESGTSYSAALITAAAAVTQCCDQAIISTKVRDRIRGTRLRKMATVSGLDVSQRNTVMERDSLCNLR